MRPLLKLIAPTGQFPDFLTPEVPVPGLDAAVEVLMDTPAEVLRGQLEPWLPPEVDRFMQGLLAGRSGSRRALGNAVRDFHQEVLAPSASELQRRYGADLAIRSRSLLHGGVDDLLRGLHLDIAWDAPVLTTYGLREGPAFDVTLDGRGLLLYPSSLTSECLVLDTPDRRPVLVYPCADLPMADDPDEATDVLADLLGRTRAAVLRSLVACASTTQLARRTGISLASASEHARVLRNAGLITTHRTSGTALHSLTPTAHHLLSSHEPNGVGGGVGASRGFGHHIGTPDTK
jgi:DNA-binding transcriptional ArsR family regulator